MEQAGGQTSVENLGEFLTKNNLETTNPFDMTLKGLKYDWRTNLMEENPKGMETFLKTTLHNNEAKRVGLRISGYNILEQPELETNLDRDGKPNAFHIELYYWKNKTGASKPKVLIQEVTSLTGFQPQDGETFLNFLRRLGKEGNGLWHESKDEDKISARFEAPIRGLPDFKMQLRVNSRKTEGGQIPLEISLDIKIPYQEIGKWLSPAN